MNAKEGFHNVLNYRGFLMFFCSKTSLFVVPSGGLEQYVNTVTVVII